MTTPAQDARRAGIIRILRAGQLTATELAKLCRCSPETIAKDLKRIDGMCTADGRYDVLRQTVATVNGGHQYRYSVRFEKRRD